jgi:hypothetical protein
MRRARIGLLLLLGVLPSCAEASAGDEDDELLGQDSALAVPEGDALSPANDNDEGASGLPNDTAAPPSASKNLYLPFRTVASHLTRYLEKQFDVLFLANSATGGAMSDLVPFQHMLMVERKTRGVGALFKRGADGHIIGFADTALVTTFPISSGLAGAHGILTYSGIFRIDREDSLRKHYTSPNAPMSYSMYIDFQYASGRDAGLAIHGTPPRNYPKLGKQRASEGCLRVRVEDAKLLKEKMMAPELFKQDLPRFNIPDRLPNKDVRLGGSGTRPGISALIITFDGF